MIVNQILAVNRIPWILEQKGIDIKELLSIDIDKKRTSAHIHKPVDLMKFDNWQFESHKNESDRYAGELIVEFEGIIFTSCVRVEEAQLLNLS